MQKEKLIEVLTKWNFWAKEIDSGILRDYTKKLLNFVKTDKIISIVGVRRSGKSTIMKQIAKELIKKIGKEDTLIVNFEEPEFEDTDLNSLQKIYDAYLEIIKPKEKPFIFLDEIQNVNKWEKFVRSLNERKEAFVIVSGSSSKLLSEELATILAGRQLQFEIFPLSFNEFLNFNEIKIENKRDILINSQKIKSLFRAYLKFGGYPEVVLNKDEEFKIRTLRNYYNDILTKDVIRRFKIKESEKLSSLVKFYLTNISSTITFNSISKFLNLSVETIRRFSSYIETSKAIFFMKRFSFSVKEQEKSPRKVYVIDVGLANALGFKFSEDIGRVAENLVAIELKREQANNPNLEIYYWKDRQGKEVDFIVKENLKIKQLVQVCWSLEEHKTKSREVRALLKASKELKCNNLLMITGDYENEEKIGNKKITYKSLWKWLLEESYI